MITSLVSFVRKKSAVIALVFLMLFSFSAVPQKTEAFEWGGQFQLVIPCVNDGVIFVLVGPPRGGAYIWTSATATYQNGPPSHSGQYGLGLAGPPYFCLLLPNIIIPLPGIIMTMLGTSQ